MMKKFVFLIFLFLIGAFAFSQSDGALFQYFSFEYISSGARSLALGNTSIANGKNIINSTMNPATLFNVERNTLEIELDYFSIEKEIYGNPLSFSSYLPSFYGGSFSFGPFTIGLFQHNFYKREEIFNVAKAKETELNLPDLSVDREIKLGEKGFNVAILLAEDIVFGFGFRRGKLSFRGNGRRANFTNNDYTFSNSSANIEASDSAWQLGLLINPKKAFSFGIAYNFGYEFDFKEIRSFYKDSALLSSQELSYLFALPSELDFGFLFKTNPKLEISFDINNRHYKDMIKKGLTILELNAASNNFELNDIREYHIGIEYIISAKKTNVIFLRGGIQLIPSHTLKFTGTTGNINYDEILKILYPKGKDEFGFSFGTGVNLKSKFYLDIGFLFSNLNKNISIAASLKL